MKERKKTRKEAALQVVVPKAAEKTGTERAGLLRGRETYQAVQAGAGYVRVTGRAKCRLPRTLLRAETKRKGPATTLTRRY